MAQAMGISSPESWDWFHPRPYPVHGSLSSSWTTEAALSIVAVDTEYPVPHWLTLRSQSRGRSGPTQDTLLICDGFMWVPRKLSVHPKFSKSILAIFSQSHEADGWGRPLHVCPISEAPLALCKHSASFLTVTVTVRWHLHLVISIATWSREWHFFFLIINWLWERT